MDKWIQKLKAAPRWVWWVGGGALLLVVFLAVRNRRTNQVAPAEAPPDTSPPPAGPSPTPPAGGGSTPAPPTTSEPSWWESAMGGLLDRQREMELELVRLRAQQAALTGLGMGGYPNRSTIGGHKTPFDAAVELAEQDKLSDEAVAALAEMVKPGGMYSTAGKFFDGPTGRELTRAEVMQRTGEGYKDPITGKHIIPGQSDKAVSRVEYATYTVTTYRRPDGTTYTERVDKPVTVPTGAAGSSGGAGGAGGGSVRAVPMN